MARVAVVGATGHIGSYLVPRLVEAGHDVVAISRGKAEPYLASRHWTEVERVALDRTVLDREGGFGAAVLASKPDIVVDMICFDLPSARQIEGALAGRVGHYLFVGTIWTYGHSVIVPTPESAPKKPFGDYGVRKAEAEAFLLRQARVTGFPATVVHPGHIVGPGWAPLNPAGNFNPAVFSALARGQRLALPNFGLETVHHVHADDVAGLLMAAMGRWRASTGESFNAVSTGALSLRGFAESMARWFGQAPNLAFQPFEIWGEAQSNTDRTATWEHIARSPNCSMEKARRLLDFVPRYTSLAAVQEAVAAMIAKGEVMV